MERLSKGLEAALLRQQVTAHNLANLNTPRFKRSEVVFEENLRRALEKGGSSGPASTHPRHLPAGGALPGPVVKVDRHTALRVDGNNVDLEREMLDLVRNQLYYQALVRQVSHRLNGWRYVLNEGRR
jgi:flagellar basal-body rod protein FlgB